MKFRILLLPAALMALSATFLAGPRSALASFAGNASAVDHSEAQFLVFNNFTDPESNDNLAFDPNIPGANGAILAIRKGAIEWGSGSYGDGSGDPTQANLGDAGFNFDFAFGGRANTAGGPFSNIISALSSGGGCTPGVLAFCQGPGGPNNYWSIKFCDDNAVFADGPGLIAPGEYDIQSVAAHEFGHVMGWGHTPIECGDAPTMSATIFAGDVSDRSLEPKEIADPLVDFTPGPLKPVITAATVDANNNLVVTAMNMQMSSMAVRVTQRFPATNNWIGAVGPTFNGGTQVSIPLPPNAGSGDVTVFQLDAFLAPDDISRPFPFQLPAGRGAPTIYCTGRASSIGCMAAITTTNELVQPTSGANDYSVIATGVHGFKPGLMFFGVNGPAAIFPWAGGYLCMNPPIGRGFIQISGGSGPNSCDGLFAQVVNDGGAFNPGLDQGPGVATWFQYWYREPNNGAGMLGTALSDAIEIIYAGP